MTPSSQVLIVAGLGRCGSSLMMQMLQAGGYPCVGEFPVFETSELNHRDADFAWWNQVHGKAVKLLDPHYSKIPNGISYITIWMRRDFEEQAKSQIKFALAMMGRDWKGRHGKHDVKKMAKQLMREDPVARASLPGPMLQVLFEDVLDNPFVMARKVLEFLESFGVKHGMRPHDMSPVVRTRPPECADGLDMEIELCRLADSKG